MTREVCANWQGAVLVCAKCSRKVGGGFGRKGTTPLAKALRGHLGLRKGRRAALGVVEVRCLGVCPRGAVTLVDSHRPDRWLLVAPATDLDDLAAALEAGRSGGGDATGRSAGPAPAGPDQA